ncbi:MAG: hypothetical protein ACM3N3_22935 [Betaproteobacteria bacterium]
MKLREHSAWPPSWTPFFGPRVAVSGEVGILNDIRLSTITGTRCIIVIGHLGTSYFGELSFDDDALCRRVVDFLNSHCGKSIAQIANLDIS